MMRKQQQGLVASIFLVFPLAITAALVLTGHTGFPPPADDSVAYAVDSSSAREASNFTENSDQSETELFGPKPPAQNASSEGLESEATPEVPATADETSPKPAAEASIVKAPVAEDTPPPAPQTPEARGSQALDKINYPWAELLPGWSISFHNEREGVYGYTLVNERRIEVYVRAGQSEEFLTHVIAHEIGHAVDVTLNTPSDRTEWQQARGIQDAPWWPGNGSSDFATGAGDFAESFAAWQVGPTSFRSKLAATPDAAQVGVLEKLAVG